jgi:hypothetical protein
LKKAETANLIELLNGYYKIDSARIKAISVAWFEAFKDYEYDDVAAAITSFAVKDVRDYPTMPGVGQIMAELEDIRKHKDKNVNRVYNAVLDGKTYDQLPDVIREHVTLEQFMAMGAIDSDVFLANRKQLKDMIRNMMEDVDGKDRKMADTIVGAD